MLAPVLIVIVIAQTPDAKMCASGSCEKDALVVAFEQAARRVLGSAAQLEIEAAESDPADDESVARASGADGVVELSVSTTQNNARVHCYVAKEQRWIDREISFGDSHGSSQSELVERGRLLGFAVASMFTSEPTHESARPEPPSEPEPAAPAPAPAPTPAAAAAPRDSPPDPEEPSRTPSARSIEFAGIVSSGLDGRAGGVGASAALRLALRGPLWARAFLAGRAGDLPEAQASTRTAQLGAGFALALLPKTHRFELGFRMDAFASYFDATHLSEDDVRPDRRSRWLPGADLLAEAGVRLSGGAGVLVAAGVEALAGKTEVYTHGDLMAVVPPFRAVAELGFRTYF